MTRRSKRRNRPPKNLGASLPTGYGIPVCTSTSLVMNYTRPPRNTSGQALFFWIPTIIALLALVFREPVGAGLIFGLGILLYLLKRFQVQADPFRFEIIPDQKLIEFENKKTHWKVDFDRIRWLEIILEWEEYHSRGTVTIFYRFTLNAIVEQDLPLQLLMINEDDWSQGKLSRLGYGLKHYLIALTGKKVYVRDRLP